MKRVTWICDGCDREGKGEHIPSEWMPALIRIIDARLDKTEYSETCDLCEKCWGKLTDFCAPKNWPRFSDIKK